MTEHKGMRVGAVLCANQTQVMLLGYGTYEGDLESPLGFPNPCIKLDSGETVWGFQCWWGPEDEIKKMAAGKEVVVVGLDGNPVNQN